ncbi:MAG: dUTP diphosphatase [Clostridium sp.]|uniref:dUTP diphosphatase n=1 Tax=Clostridium sp. TaxID=1506 RepID=UPI003EE72C20
MKLKVKLTNGGVFKTNKEFDSCYDVCAVGYSRVVYNYDEHKHEVEAGASLEEGEKFIIKPQETVMIHTGVYLELPKPIDCGSYYKVLEAQARGRSGMSLKENSNVKLGTIDNEYIGECNIIMVNDGVDAVVIKRGDRIGQIAFNEVVKFKPESIEFVDKLSESNRGTEGFGASGK